MVQWEEVQKALSQIRSFEDLSRHFQDGFSYAFVQMKLGSEIDNAHRIARLVPKVVS